MKRTNISHSAPISGVATSGTNLIATAGYDNQIILWDVQTGIAITRVYHDHLVNQCEFSRDGNLLISASSDYTGRIWSVPDMRLLAVLNGHSDDVIKASFCPSGERVATCSYDGTLRIFDLKGKCLLLCEGHTGLIETFDWNIDGTEIKSCGTDGTIKTWCTYSGQIKHIENKFDHDMDTLLVIGENHFIVGDDKGDIISCIHGRNFCQKAHVAGLKRLVRHKDILLSIGYDQKVILWRILSDGSLDKFCSDKLPNYVWARSASFLNNETIVFASFGSTYISWHWSKKFWDCGVWQPSVSKNALVIRGEDVFSTGDSGLIFKNDKQIADAGSLCNCISLVDDVCLVAGQVGTIFDAFNYKMIFQHISSINCCSSYIDTEGNKIVVFGTYDGSLIFLRLQSKKMDNQVQLIKLECNAIKGIAILDKQILCGSADGTLTLLDGLDNVKKSTIKGAHDGIINSVTTYKHGFATVSRDLTMRLWDKSGNLKQILRTRHPKSVKCVASSSDGNLTASGSYGGTVDIYDHKSAKWFGSIKRPTLSGISALAWSDHLGCFVASSYDGNCYHV